MKQMQRREKEGWSCTGQQEENPGSKMSILTLGCKNKSLGCEREKEKKRKKRKRKRNWIGLKPN
jgi:hypothetical protein